MKKYLFLISLLFPFLCSCSFIGESYGSIWESRYTTTGIIILIISLIPIAYAAIFAISSKMIGGLLIWFYIHTLYVIPYLSNLYDGIESSIARFFAAIGLIILGLGLYTGPLGLFTAIAGDSTDFTDIVKDYWIALIAQPVIYVLGLAFASHWKIGLIIVGIIIIAAVIKWRIKVAKETRIAREAKKEAERKEQKRIEKAKRKEQERIENEARLARQKEERKTLIKSTSELDIFYKIGNQKRRKYSTNAEGHKHGNEKVYYRNGKINKVQNWQNGLLQGEAVTYRQDGSVYMQEIYENGHTIERKFL